MWVEMPAEFGSVVKDLSPDEKNQSNKSLYVIKFDDQQRNFSADPKYYGIFWSSDGPESVNKIAISLWDRFPTIPLSEEHHRDCEDNINGSSTGDGECYTGFACFGYGSIAISLYVEQVEADHTNEILRLYRIGLLQQALNLNNVSTPTPKEVKQLMVQLNKAPRDRDEDCMRRIHTLIGGPIPQDLPRNKPTGM